MTKMIIWFEASFRGRIVNKSASPGTVGSCNVFSAVPIQGLRLWIQVDLLYEV